VTNLAHAFKNDPATFKRVHSVIWMGGAMDVPGNTSPSAEFNCFADPYAADQILAACKQGAFKLIMAPLDITSPHTVPFDDLIVTKPEDDVAKQDKNGVPGPLRVFISSFLHRVRGLQASFGAPDAMEMHDPLAIWYAIDNADLPTGSNGWETEQRDFKIERNGEITRGMCVIDRRGGKDGSGELRTKDESLQGNKVPGQKDHSEEEGQKPLPYIITKTPGKENLRKLLLARVFGEEV
jgi:inosine-uridine nucleoside N-ribohydrolase